MKVRTRNLVIGGLVVSLLLAGVVSFWASEFDDGLEWVAGELGFGDEAQENETQAKLAPMPDYAVPGMESPFASNAVAGVTGTLVVFGVAMGAAFVLRRRKAAKA